MSRRPGVPAALLALALAAGLPAGCGDGDASSGRPPGATTTPPPLELEGVTVFAAASLGEVFRAMAPDLRHSTGGSDQLAFQIRQGAPADVFASANVRYAEELAAGGLVETPVVFATNSLVVVVPRDNPAGIREVADLARPGVRLVIGDATVPVGEYTRQAFAALALRDALRNVVSNEPDVRGVTQKVALGEADAGVVYRTDARSVADRVTVVEFPASAAPAVRYAIAVTSAAADPEAAQAFVDHLTGPEGRAWLTAYGFTPAP